MVTALKLKDYKETKMQDPEFARAYEEIQPEMNVIRAMVEARHSQNLTQRKLFPLKDAVPEVKDIDWEMMAK